MLLRSLHYFQHQWCLRGHPQGRFGALVEQRCPPLLAEQLGHDQGPDHAAALQWPALPRLSRYERLHARVSVIAGVDLRLFICGVLVLWSRADVSTRLL